MRFATIHPIQLQGTSVTIPNQAPDFETLGRQVWESWARQWQPPGAAAPAADPSGSAPFGAGMDALKNYFGWMQGLMPNGMGAATVPPMANPFASWNPANAATAWSSAGLDGLRELLQTPAFGYTREQQAQQQELARAMLDHQQASARYQQLIARAQTEGAARMQRKLAESGTAAPSLKAMYDLWVDAVEEAYEEIALSDEFREAYGAMTNTQMRVRKLQQQQIEHGCREVGLPTRSEVDTLGQRVQELRRDLRRMQAAAAGSARAPESSAEDTRPARRAGPVQPATRAKSTAKRKSKPPAKSRATATSKSKPKPPAKSRAAAKSSSAARPASRRAPRKPR
jgi:polyhydroxyalkanoate synthase subunit PhaE